MTSPFPALLSEKQRLRIQTRHRYSLERFGYTPQALFWSSREIQQQRFEILAQVFDASKTQQAGSVLDVGCGFGDLRAFLQKNDIHVDYQGIDLSADMVQSAGFQYPGIQVMQGDLFDLNPADESFDYVLLSGALNEVVETEAEHNAGHEGRYAKAVIRRMYQTCRIAVAFNLLDARNQWVRARSDLQSFEPQQIVDYCRSFASRVVCCEGYLDNDFTVFLYKR
ncbi:class I SAM-dependent methyltransferase [Thiomicrorhabdus cannonii]|uniref:class I SAM-dependent methyltransferase n=1 Tax=Thiomicrorhabdus cannonii TaxID=2748011 RepID=UPI0015B9D255|nr:class I SAM-dependent methyltransferase [Thiomicrorhabdus cannonii]